MKKYLLTLAFVLIFSIVANAQIPTKTNWNLGIDFSAILQDKCKCFNINKLHLIAHKTGNGFATC